MIAWKNLLHDKTRLLISVLGIATAIVLILLIEGLAAGIYEQGTAFINNSGADLIVAQDGADSMQASRSVLPLQMSDLIFSAGGINNVAGIITVPVNYERGGQKTPIMVVGYRLGQRLGQPWSLAEGRRPQEPGEAVFDLALARRNGLEIGDRPKILGKKFRIVGLSLETSSWMNPYVFISSADAARITGMQGAVSYFLVETEEPGFAPHVKAELAETTRTIDVFSRERMAANDRTILEDILSAPINVMIGIAYIVGFMVIGLTTYAAVVEKLGEYGVAKAIGADNRRLYGIVVRQTLAVTIISLALGIGMAFGAQMLIELALPRFAVLITPLVIERTLVGVLLIGLIGSALPVRRMARLDPAAVFK